MASFARWCFRHRLIVVIAWLAVLATVIGVDRGVGNAYTNTFDLPGTESTRPSTCSARPCRNSPATRTRSCGTWPRVGQRPGGAGAHQGAAALVARSPSVAGVTESLQPRPAPPRSAGTARRPTPRSPSPSSPTAAPRPTSSASSIWSRRPAAGPCRWRSAARPSSRPRYTPPSNSEAIGLVAAAVIILIAFGSLLGMALPLITAVVALGTATFAIGLFSHVMGVSTYRADAGGASSAWASASTTRCSSSPATATA